MGNAFTAQADDPSALHYNPAGMTQLRGVQLMTGALFVGWSTEYTSPTGVTTVGNRDGSVAWPPPTHFYLIANLKDLGLNALGDMTAGVGVTVPFGVQHTFLASYIRKNDKTTLNQDADQFALGYRYALSKRTDLYAMYAHIKNKNGAPYTVGSSIEAGSGNSAWNMGIRHTF